VVNVEVLGKKGHESFTQLSPQEAEQLVQRFLQEGGRYWILDKETKEKLKEPLKLDPEAQIILVPVIGGG